jgi:hypothetical protein
MGGTQRDGLDITELPEVGYVVESFHVEFESVGCELTARFILDDQLRAAKYSFHYGTSSGELLWREDKHPGHEDEHGGPWHLHVGKSRRRSSEKTMEDIAKKIRQFNSGFGGEEL